MNTAIPWSRVLAVLTFFVSHCALASPPSRLLFEAADEANVPKYVPTNCSMQVVQTDMGPALELAFGHKTRWPSVHFLPDRLGYSTDWSKYTFLALTASNSTKVPAKLNVRVDSASEKSRGRQGGVEVMPGSTVRMLLPIGGREAIVGMRGQPPIAYQRQENDVEIAHNNVALDPQQITRFQVFMGRPDKDHTLCLHRIELLSADDRAQRAAFVDRFGQYNGAQWPGKLHEESELAERIQAEQAYFKANPPLPDRDPYGGWQDGPQLEATGRFRVQKHDGKWWLVDPAGKLFWSSGITCVRLNAETRVAGRRQYFEWLPEASDPLARFYANNQRKFDFFEANIYRKYGDDFLPKFYDVTTKRLQSWASTRLPTGVPRKVGAYGACLTPSRSTCPACRGSWQVAT